MPNKKYWLILFLLHSSTNVFSAEAPGLAKNETMLMVFVPEESNIEIPYEDNQKKEELESTLLCIFSPKPAAITAAYADEEDQLKKHGLLHDLCTPLMKVPLLNFIQRPNIQNDLFGTYLRSRQIYTFEMSNEKSIRERAAQITEIPANRLRLGIYIETSTVDPITKECFRTHQFFPGPHTTQSLYKFLKQNELYLKTLP